MTALGIENPNSNYNQSERAASSPLALVPALPLLRSQKIDNLEKLIRAIGNMRAFKFATGNIPEARLHAIRIGTVRAELRALKAGRA